jgi:alpha-glucosidase (family GH31 glycosyl hydrolase)
MQKFSLFLIYVLCFKSSFSQTKTLSIPLQKDEKVWAGIVTLGHTMPLKTGFSFDFASDNLGNQLQPLVLTSKGRYIWSEEPYKFEVKNDRIILSHNKAKIETAIAGKTLAEARLAAEQKFFKTNGKTPDLLLFSKPQYNTWIELNFNHNQADILKYAHKLIDQGYPPGVFMIDNSWQERHGVWLFHSGRFPDPKAMIDELHGLGFKVMLWVSPFVNPDLNPLIRKLRSENLLLKVHENSAYDYYKGGKAALIQWWDGYSVELDFSNPAAVKWFTEQLDILQKEYGVDGFKFDAGDMRFYPSFTSSFVPNTSPNKHSQLFAEIGLRYPLNEYRACWKMAGLPLAQRLRDKQADWEDLRKLLPDMLVGSLVGYNYNCPDMIGGGEFKSFENNDKIDQEMMVRSAQCHALMPMMQFSVAPWRILDQKHHDAVKKAVEIRKEFTPMLMQLVEESARTGEPIIRLMDYVFPNQGFQNTTDQYMLGSKLLVAPQQFSGHTRTVLLPQGRWKADDGTVYEGGQKININVALERLPYFHKID